MSSEDNCGRIDTEPFIVKFVTISVFQVLYFGDDKNIKTNRNFIIH
jgi:hypothetical protein